MGAVGGLLGVGGGASGTGFQVSNPVTGQQINTAYTGAQNSLQAQQNLLAALQGQGGLQNQSQVYGQLQNIAAGQGPNPAQAMLNQATGANVANQAALQAGQRGAAQNVGLIARQAGQQGMQAQQQAAGQAATMQANQALGAIGQAGQMANTMAANQVGQTNANQQANLGEQQALLQAQQGYNQQQAGLAQTGMQGQQGLIGGVLGGVGSALGLAGGGSVPQTMDSGGISGDQSAFSGQSKFGKVLAGMSQGMAGSEPAGSGPGALQQGMTKLGSGIGKAIKGKQPTQTQTAAQYDPSAQGPGGNADPTATTDMPITPPTMPPSYNPNEMGGVTATQDPSGGITFQNNAHGGTVGDKLKKGGGVPGQAKVRGDSYANDTVEAKLSPGEVVIPRSVMQSKDPIKGSAEFVRAVLAKKKGKS